MPVLYISTYQATSFEFEVFTYNRTSLQIFQQESTNTITVPAPNPNVPPTLLEVKCHASGGRPRPQIRWMINKVDLSAFDNFEVTERQLEPEDFNGYIENRESEVRVKVDLELIEVLGEVGVETRLRGSEDIEFDLWCEGEQDGVDLVQGDFVKVVIVNRE